MAVYKQLHKFLGVGLIDSKTLALHISMFYEGHISKNRGSIVTGNHFRKVTLQETFKETSLKSSLRRRKHQRAAPNGSNYLKLASEYKW